MVDFDYSVEALNARNIFLKVESIIYVEGEDDVPFWHEIFSKIPGFAFEIEPRNGSKELDKYIELIEAGTLNAIAARDSDYIKFINNKSESPKVIYTIGYSIENTLFTINAIHAIAKTWCKVPTLKSEICEEWLNQFSTSFKGLLIHDICNEKAGIGLNVLYDNCGQFMKGKISCTPCELKISEKHTEISTRIPTEMINEVEREFTGDITNVVLSIRGHFLASGVSKFITRQATTLGRKIALSNDGLYMTALSYFTSHFNESHPHYEYYITHAQKAIQASQIT